MGFINLGSNLVNMCLFVSLLFLTVTVSGTQEFTSLPRGLIQPLKCAVCYDSFGVGVLYGNVNNSVNLFISSEA